MPSQHADSLCIDDTLAVPQWLAAPAVGFTAGLDLSVCLAIHASVGAYVQRDLDQMFIAIDEPDTYRGVP